MSDGSTRYDDLVAQHGLSGTHRQTIEWVPEGARVLELGCSSGFIGKILIDAKGCNVTGVEVDPAAAAEARTRGLTVLCGSLEDPELVTAIGSDYDIVIATDVLEHLSYPAPVLAQFRQWLAPGGKAIVAVPNVATWTMRAQLFFRGDFTYQDTGLLDRTHLRFFTWDTFHTFVEEGGWNVEDVMVDSWEVPGTQTLMFELPLSLQRAVGKREDEAKGLRRALLRNVRIGSARMMNFHQDVGRSLGRRFPNLCAKHISVLLS